MLSRMMLGDQQAKVKNSRQQALIGITLRHPKNSASWWAEKQQQVGEVNINRRTSLVILCKSHNELLIRNYKEQSTTIYNSWILWIGQYGLTIIFMEQKSDKNIHMCHYIYKRKTGKTNLYKKDRTVNTPGSVMLRKGDKETSRKMVRFYFLVMSADYSVFHL